MRTLDINVQDGMGLIDIAVRQENFTRLRDYLKDCEVAFNRLNEALEELAQEKAEMIKVLRAAGEERKELAELKKMIKELP